MIRPQRREVRIVDLGYTAKVRPCLVLSVPPNDSERALVTLVPHTTKPRQSRFEVAVKMRFLRSGVFDAQGLVTVPRVKLMRSLGKLTSAEVEPIEEAVRSWLGLHR